MKNSIQTLLLVAALVTSACSSGAPSITIDIYGLDDMQFGVKDTADYLKTGEEIEVDGERYFLLEAIHAEPGQHLTVNLETISHMNKEAIAHNWVLLSMRANPREFALESQMADDNNYIAPEYEDFVIEHIPVVGNGESTSIEFSLPDSSGNYDFICSFPGHYTGGMHGILSLTEDAS